MAMDMATATTPDTIASKTGAPDIRTAQAAIGARGLVSNLGPLTTTFAPPTDCRTLGLRSAERTEPNLWDQFYAVFGATCSVDDAGDAKTFVPESCYPSAFAEHYNNPDNGVPIAYSPGLACPFGYATACTVVRGQSYSASLLNSSTDLYGLWDMLQEGETAVACCPAGYVCRTDFYGGCESTAASNEVVTVVSYDPECKPSTWVTEIDDIWVDLNGPAQIAEAPQVVLIQGDATATPTSNDSLDDGPPEDGSSAGLSQDGIIAIGVLVPLVALALFAAVVLFLKRGKRFKQPNPSGLGGDAVVEEEVQGSGTTAIARPPHGVIAVQKPELDAALSEMTSSAQNKAAELPGTHPSALASDNAIEEGRLQASGNLSDCQTTQLWGCSNGANYFSP